MMPYLHHAGYRSGNQEFIFKKGGGKLTVNVDDLGKIDKVAAV